MDLEKLFKDFDYNPTDIGVEILRLQGYRVDTYYNYENGDSIFVYDKKDKDKNKMLYWK